MHGVFKIKSSSGIEEFCVFNNGVKGENVDKEFYLRARRIEH